MKHFLSSYFLCLESNASGVSLQRCSNFVEQLKFSLFEGSIIPFKVNRILVKAKRDNALIKLVYLELHKILD